MVQRFLARFLRPFLVFPLLVVVSLQMGEWYPFSNFPMYSDPNHKPTEYVFLGDADDLDEQGSPRPIEMQALVGLRAAKTKKIFRSDKIEFASKLGKDKSQLTHEELCEVAAKTLAYCRERQEHMGTREQLPARMAFVLGEIELVLGEGIQEKHTILATEQ